MLYKLIGFPIWKNDGKPVVKTNDLQNKYIRRFISKVESGEYKFVKNPCLCSNKDESLDILISEKDRYGIPCNIVLCKRCGLIRLRERLDDQSTVEFYKNEYRPIYTGSEFGSESFFDSQVERGKYFFNLVKKAGLLNEIRTVFEVGCGAGGILFPFYQAGKVVSGCDYNENYLKLGTSKGLKLYKGDPDSTKTPHNSQDLVILSHVMEHFNEPVKSLNDVIKLVTPGKFLLIEVPGIFYIPKTYFNPILYFQNAHVYNYYYYYLKVFFEKMGLSVIYGDERCTFLVKKPLNWIPKDNIVIYEPGMEIWAEKIEKALKKYYIVHLLKLNPYYLKNGLARILEKVGLKEPVKKLLSKSRRLR